MGRCLRALGPGDSNICYTADRLLLKRILRRGGWEFKTGLFIYIVMNAHVEVDLSLVVSERICTVNAALDNSVRFFLLSLSV